jgi:lipid-A-disaccharide synthase
MPADVFFSAGEASGDLQAALLLSSLRRLRPELRADAVGGPRLRAAGADVIVDSVAGGWASIGHLRAYLKIPWLLLVMLGIARRLMAEPPRLLVCVDFGAFNLRMLEWLRFCGYRGKALYYFPPGAWLDNASQARKVARVSAALTPFEHQEAFYRSIGLPIAYAGHPLVSLISPRAPRGVGIPPTVAVLPGSRDEEVGRHLPVLVDAATRLARTRGAKFVVVAATDALAPALREAWPAECGGEGAVVRSDAASAVSDADLAWVASGTAVLETALRGVPEIAFYRLGEAQYKIAQRRIPHIVAGPITLPNLVLRESVVPELLQYEFAADRLVASSEQVLDDAGSRDHMLAAYARLRKALGPDDSLDRIASYVSSLL